MQWCKGDQKAAAKKPPKRIAQPSKGSSAKQQVLIKLKATRFTWTALDDFRLIANIEQV
jgi:hypothetical protein